MVRAYVLRVRSLYSAMTSLAAVVGIALLILAAMPAHAQQFTTLYPFCSQANCADGSNPYSGGRLVQGTDGNFYGVTFQGGIVGGYGTVFKVTPGGSFTQLYAFCPSQANDCPDGFNPVGLTQGADGFLYGATFAGGAYGGGTIFRVSPGGGFAHLADFCGGDVNACPPGVIPNGGAPRSGPIQGSDLNFYGTTFGGGSNAHGGTVFEFSLSGGLTTLAKFPCDPVDCTGSYTWPDGSNPWDSLVQGSDGNFYGTAHQGTESTSGPSGTGFGTIFRITPDGAMTDLYNFCQQPNCSDGAYPLGGLVQGSDGNFYGTTSGLSGPLGSSIPNVGGSVFKITPGGAFTTLHTFCSQNGCTDGVFPTAGVIQGTDGAFYGTTQGGGAYGAGSIFKITSGGTLTTLYSFCAQGGFFCPDGVWPLSGVIQGSDGNLYGTTNNGGVNNGGTVFKLTIAQNVNLVVSPSPMRIPDSRYSHFSVVVLSNANFNSFKEIDYSSVTFGVAGHPLAPTSCRKGAWEDTRVDNDGVPDAACEFPYDTTEFQLGPNTVVMNGKFVDGTPFEGSAVVTALAGR